MKRILFTLLAVAALCASAEDQKPEAPPPPTALPTITAEQQRDYLANLLALQSAQSALDRGLTDAQKQMVRNMATATQALDAQTESLRQICAARKETLTTDQSGVPICRP